MLKTGIVLITFGIIISGITFAQASELTKITVTIIGDPVIVIQENVLIRANVEIENYDPAEGYYFMKVINVTDGSILNESEIQPKFMGDDIWGVQVAYMAQGNELGVGEYEIQIVTEFGTASASTKFTVVETSTAELKESEVKEVEKTIQTPKTPTELNSLVDGQWVKYQVYFGLNDGDLFSQEQIDAIMAPWRENFKEVYGATPEELDEYEIAINILPDGSIKATASSTLKNGQKIPASLPKDLLTGNSIPFSISTKTKLGDSMQNPTGFGNLKVEGIKNSKDFESYSMDDRLYIEENVEVYQLTSSRFGKQNSYDEESYAHYIYDTSTGILLAQIVGFSLNDYRSFEYFAADYGLNAVEISKDIPILTDDKGKKTKNEITKSLSDLFIKTSDDRFWITGETVSIYGEPGKTTYDIIRVKDNSELGILIIYGDEEVSKVTATTFYSLDKRNLDDANDILIIIRQQLVPNCCYPLPTHSRMMSEHFDEGIYGTQENFDGVEVSIGWRHDNAFGIGFFSQDIVFSEDIGLDKSLTESMEEPSEGSKSVTSLSTNEFEQETEANPAFIAVGVFVVLGIPIIIIALIIWKIKKRGRMKKIKMGEY